MKPIAVVTTVASKKEARAMAQAPVEARLAACAQISRIESVYAWKDAIEHGKEYRVSCRRSTPSPSSMSCRPMPRGSRRIHATARSCPLRASRSIASASRRG